MTVVLAVLSSDGLVLGGDSQITDSARDVSYPAQKLHPLGDTAAWGGSGARAVLHDVEKLFESSPGTILEADNVGRAIQEQVKPILEHHYDNFIPEVPGEETAGGPSAYVLAAGYARGEPFLVEVNPHAMVSRLEDIGFHAIGSGAAMAQQAAALLGHFQMRDRRVEYGVVAVVRVLDALRVTAPYVGGPIDICRMTPEGAHHLSEEEIEAVRKDVQRWTDLEEKALDDLFG